MLWTVVKEAVENWFSHKDSRQGAALAYYSIFSLGPIIVIAIALAGFFFGREAASEQVAATIKNAFGNTGAQAIQAMLADAGRPRHGFIATLLGPGVLIFAAIGVVVQLKDALNTVWEVETAPSPGIWYFVRSYLVSLAAVLSLGFLLIVSLLVTAGLEAFGKYAAPHVQVWFLDLVTVLTSIGVTSLLFAMMFKWLPDAAIDWYDVWLGAIVTASLFELGKSAIGYYIGKRGLESSYGASASIIVVLIWVYYFAQIFLMGAEITHAFAKHKGSIKNREQ